MDKLKELMTVNGLTEAWIVKDLLMSNGIMAELHYDPVASIMGLNIGKLGAVKILVREEELEDARKIIESALETDRDQGL